MNKRTTVFLALASALLVIVGAAMFFTSSPNNGLEANATPEPEVIEHYGSVNERDEGHGDTKIDSISKRKSLIDEIDGRVTIRIWDRQPVDLSLYSTDYQALVDLANEGDGTAAYLLSNLLKSCKGVAFGQSKIELESEISNIEQTHSIEVEIDGVRQTARISDDSPENLTLFLQAKRLQYDTCNAIPPDRRAEAGLWLDRAVEAGAGFDALLAQARGRLDLRDSEQSLLSAWQSGDSRALTDLSLVYRNLYKNGEYPRGNVASYAYLLASVIVTQRLGLAGTADGPGSWYTERLFEEVLHEGDNLHEHEFIEAQELAIGIINDNSECCVNLAGR